MSTKCCGEPGVSCFFGLFVIPCEHRTYKYNFLWHSMNYILHIFIYIHIYIYALQVVNWAVCACVWCACMHGRGRVLACVFVSLGVRLRWAEADGILLSVSICWELWPQCSQNTVQSIC